MPDSIPAHHKKRRIFCVITQGETGGAQQFVAQLAQHLNADRFDLHVVWGSSSHRTLARLLPAWATHATADHLVREVSPLQDFRAIGELRRMMLAYQPDIVFLISSKAGFIGSRAAHGLRAQLPNLRIIYRIGGWTFNDPWPLWKKRVFLALEKYAARWKDTIVLNNTFELDQAHLLGIKPRGHVLRIYNGIDPYLQFLEPHEARASLETHLPDRARNAPAQWLVGTIANLYPAKDIANLVRAAARVSENVRFVVIGDGPQRQELERMIDQYELANRFFILGRIEHAWRYLRGLDVFVLPSAKEGFPWALLEAMAAKVPTVATYVGAVPEMIHHRTSGMLAPAGDAEQIAQCIVELLSDERLRQDVTIAAHQQVISKFSVHTMTAEFEKLFSE